ncbi:hypothetical protein [Actinacidiphila alni]|uniref:hypothetical protein n=1 Tax=Actinacidiphila alni TaxID=380248 RepID=UPI0011601E5C|nr:hypothetical protein [Actinacidiphila alni]
MGDESRISRTSDGSYRAADLHVRNVLVRVHYSRWGSPSPAALEESAVDASRAVLTDLGDRSP